MVVGSSTVCWGVFTRGVVGPNTAIELEVHLDTLTPARVAAGTAEDSVVSVRLKVSSRKAAPGAIVPRRRLAALRTAFGNIAGAPKSNTSGSAKLPALSEVLMQMRVGRSLFLMVSGIEI
jgi:hypothetical protein